MSKLYLVPTPIGNLEDITLRAIRILKEVDLILAEDTRTSRPLLNHFEIKTPLQAHHLFNEHEQVERVVGEIKFGEIHSLNYRCRNARNIRSRVSISERMY